MNLDIINDILKFIILDSLDFKILYIYFILYMNFIGFLRFCISIIKIF